MRKTRLLVLGITAGLLAVTALLASCNLAAPTDPAAEPTSQWSSTLIMVGFIVLIFVMMYFLTIRPQRKRQQEQQKLISEIRRGDKVITIGGMYGAVENVTDDSITLRTESGAMLKFAKSAVHTKVADQSPNTGS